MVTHCASGLIQYAAWVDSSTVVAGLGAYPLVKMELSKSFEFADQQTARSFHQQRALFRRMHDRDRHQSYSESFDVPGFKSNVLCCKDGEKPALLTSSCFFLSTLATLNWPFRIWLERHSMKTSIVIRKRVAAQPQSLAVFGPLMFLGGIAGNFPLVEALVFHEMYGKQKQNLPPAVAHAIPIATAVPLADAVPVYDPTSAGECFKTTVAFISGESFSHYIICCCDSLHLFCNPHAATSIHICILYILDALQSS